MDLQVLATDAVRLLIIVIWLGGCTVVILQKENAWVEAAAAFGLITGTLKFVVWFPNLSYSVIKLFQLI